MDPRVTDPDFYEGRPDYGKVAWYSFVIAIIVAVLGFLPKKGWVALKKAFIYMTAGRHIPMEGKDDLIKGD